jgi:RimJ/RimL family protein N-acetyltransferase/uncharacterized protein YhfF
MSRPIRPLGPADLDAYTDLMLQEHAESGSDGDPYFGPYSRYEIFPADGMRERTRERWRTPLDEIGWRRAWGVFDGPQLVGSGHVAGGSLPTELHRGTLGVGILRGYRQRGLGRRLIGEIVAWCRAEPRLDWLDLGVFADNAPAWALYRKIGFVLLGDAPDRYRIDGHSIEDITMTLPVSEVAAATIRPARRSRLQFVSDRLVQQVVDHRKTASVALLDEVDVKEDEHNDPLVTGREYDVLDSARIRRAAIRITGMELCRWEDIPERLWRGETSTSADGFREDHREFFGSAAGPGFEFVAYYFRTVDPPEPGGELRR